MKIADHLCIGDEELTPLFAEASEKKQDDARKSHQDGSHAHRAWTWNQRLEYGFMMQELAGDV